jgi:hypothetical protein
MVENRESSDLLARADPLIDPELVALPRPPRQERTLSLLLMALTALLAVFMTVALAGDVKYALAGDVPESVGALSALAPAAAMSNRFVRAEGTLRSDGAVRYRRPLENDSFQLVPVSGNDRVWVELRVPPVPANASSAPPVTFVGRLMPIQSIAFGFGGLRRSMSTGASIPTDAWVLVDGATPVASHWTVGLAALLALFAAYNLFTIGRILRPAR